MRLVNSWEASWQTACDTDPVSSFRTGRKLAAEVGCKPEVDSETEGLPREISAGCDKLSGRCAGEKAVI